MLRILKLWIVYNRVLFVIKSVTMPLVKAGRPPLLSVLAASLRLPSVGTCWARKARSDPYGRAGAT